jgi:hypothetical protein
LGIRIAPDLWEELCRALEQYPFCQVTLQQQNGQVCGLKIDVTIRAKSEAAQSSVVCMHTPDNK